MSDQRHGTTPDRGVSRKDAVKLGVAGLAGAAGAAMLIPAAADAADGPLQMGTSNTSSAVTRLSNTNTGDGLSVSAIEGDGISGDAGGATGSKGVAGFNTGAVGVYGESGSSGSNIDAPQFGVHGVSDKTGQSAVCGEHVGDGNGVLGTVSAADGAGVVGQNVLAGDGVLGESNGGAAVHGHDLSSEVTSYGVFGQSPNGSAVYGVTTTGAALAGLANGAGGVGLYLQGRAVYSDCGIATVKGTAAKPKSSVKVGQVSLSAQSMVLATIQTNNAPGTFIQSAIPNPAGASVTINLNQNVAVAVKVAWFVVDLVAQLLLYSLIVLHREASDGDVLAYSIMAMAIFPVTMAYVIVVDRALDVRMMVRRACSMLSRGGRG